jgi:hypothetical protein
MEIYPENLEAYDPTLIADITLNSIYYFITKNNSSLFPESYHLLRSRNDGSTSSSEYPYLNCSAK